MATERRFPPEHLAAFRAAKILGVRAGSEHRHTGVWVVAVDGRVFVRSWNDKATGWYRAFLETPEGTAWLKDRQRSGWYLLRGGWHSVPAPPCVGQLSLSRGPGGTSVGGGLPRLCPS